MYEVAVYLQGIVCSGGVGSNNIDEFARTTFNRYYYAAFHKAKQMVETIDPKQGAMPHKSYPEFLRKSFLNEINRGLKRGRKTKTLSPHQYYSLEARAKHAAHELARLLDAAYSTRVIADYELATRVLMRAGGYSLAGTDVKDAARWLNNANNFCAALESVRREINV